MEKALGGPRRARIQIDLNSRARDGSVRARMSRVRGQIAVGSTVTVYEPEDEVAASAEVLKIDAERGFVYLDVDWATLDEDVYVTQQFELTTAFYDSPALSGALFGAAGVAIRQRVTVASKIKIPLNRLLVAQ